MSCQLNNVGEIASELVLRQDSAGPEISLPSSKLILEGEAAASRIFGVSTATSSSYSALNNSPEIKVEPIEYFNVLLMGEKGVGKTTFRHSLRNVHHLASKHMNYSNGDRKSQTVVDLDCEREQFLVRMGESNMMIHLVESRVCANPLFHDQLAKLTQEWTKLHLCLIAVNTTHPQLDITEYINFLGFGLIKNVGFLVTHCDLMSPQAQKDWINRFYENNQNQLPLLQDCQGGFFFTGAMEPAVFEECCMRDRFVALQQARHRTFLQSLMSISPVVLSGNICSPLRMEPQLTSLLHHIPQAMEQIDEEKMHILDQRVKFRQILKELEHKSSGMIDSSVKRWMESARDAVEQASDLDIEPPVMDAAGFRNVVREYKKYHSLLLSHVQHIRLTGQYLHPIYLEVVQTEKHAKLLWQSITMFSDADDADHTGNNDENDDEKKHFIAPGEKLKTSDTIAHSVPVESSSDESVSTPAVRLPPPVVDAEDDDF